MLRKSVFLFAAETEAQLLRDFGRDVILHGEDIGDLAIVTSAPQFGAVRDVNQVSFDVKGVAALGHLPRDYCLNVEIAPDLSRIYVTVLVGKHGIVRQHPEVGKLRKTANQAFRDAVAQVFGVRVVTGIDKGQDCQRIDLAPWRMKEAKPSHNRDHRDQRENAGCESRSAAPPCPRRSCCRHSRRVIASGARFGAA